MKIGKYRNLVTIAVILAGFLLCSSRSYAGEKSINNLFIVPLDGSFIFGGSLADIRNSPNTSDYLTCETDYAGPGKLTAYCNAYQGSSQTHISCQSTDPQFVQIVMSIKNDSYIILDTNLGVNGATPTCNWIGVSHGSVYSPKQP